MKTLSFPTLAAASLATMLALFAPDAVMAQGGGLSEVTPAGTEYYVGFMQNDDEAGGAYAKFMGLLITSQVATVGTVEIPGFGPQMFSTRPGEFTAISIPRALEHTISEDTIGNGATSIVAAVRITARAPVSVFVLNSRHQSTAGYAAIPTSMWGTRYLPLTLPNSFGERTSELMIVASADNTVVRFTPSAQTVRADQSIPVEIVLNRGRTYFVKARAGGAGVADLSGSEIIASRPIGVSAGHVRTPITLDGSIPSDPQAYATHHAAMMLPDSLWGTEFVSVPLRSGGDRFRIMPARQASVIITHYGPAGIGRDTLALDAGEVRDISRIDGQPLSGPIHWQSSQPAMVLQLRTGGRYGDPLESPAMMPLTSVGSMTRRSAFVAIDRIADGVFTRHDLTLIVRVPDEMGDDASRAFHAIQLDGVRLDELATPATPTRIGATSLYYTTLPVPSGGHALVADEGVTISGYVFGNNGAINRDAYLWTLPTWGEPAQFDNSSPYVVALSSPAKGTISVTVSDASDGYFSGVGEVEATASSTGWTRTAFNVPMPNEAAQATFRATADPSGDLTLRLRDRDGNYKDTLVSGSICFKTATTDTDTLRVAATAGKSGVGILELEANSCGDEAHVRSVVFGGGTVAINLEARFDNGQTTTTIPPNGSAALSVVSNGSIPVGRHQTTMRISVDDSTVVIPIVVVISPPSAVADEHSSSLALSVYPNPVTSAATIATGRALSSRSSLRICDRLGRIVIELDADALSGRSSISWDGRDASGSELPSGIYILTLVDGNDRVTSGLSIVR